jgi:DNA-nicking Smr family endonuclease
LSHKIKLSIKDTAKNLEELPNQKISISLGDKKKIKSKAPFENSQQIEVQKKKPSKSVTFDQQLFKQFKNATFSKIDLHGLTVDEAHQTLAQYVKKKILLKKSYYIL